MATLVGKEMDINTLIKDMISLEYDALAAYRACVERLENPEYKQKLSEFILDHDNHLNELTQYAIGMNIDVSDAGPDAKAMLTKGKVVLANIFGDDAILAAMKTNEDDTVTAYERACKHENLPVNIRATFEKGYQDELRHRSYMENAAKKQSNRAA